MVELILFSLAVMYLLMAQRFFNIWFAIFRQDTSMSSEEPLAIMVLVMMTIFWPLIVPFAYLELLNAKKTVESPCSQLKHTSLPQPLTVGSHSENLFAKELYGTENRLLFVSWYQVEP